MKEKWNEQNNFYFPRPPEGTSKLTGFLFGVRNTNTNLLIVCNVSGNGGQIPSAFIVQPHEGWKERRKGHQLLWLAIWMLWYMHKQTKEMQKHWKMVQWWQAELDPSLLCLNTGYRFYLYFRSMYSHYQNCAHVTLISRVITLISRIMTPESWHKPPLEIILSMQNSSALKEDWSLFSFKTARQQRRKRSCQCAVSCILISDSVPWAAFSGPYPGKHKVYI